jgi:DNA-directed RNA polymerase I, II, and III subunit RPABC5
MDPIRCFTCNKIIGNKWNKYRDLYQQMENEQNTTLTYDSIMKELGISRYCCKRMFKTSVDVTEKILDYKQVHNTMKDNPYVTYKTTTVDKTIRSYSTN